MQMKLLSMLFAELGVQKTDLGQSYKLESFQHSDGVYSCENGYIN